MRHLVRDQQVFILPHPRERKQKQRCRSHVMSSVIRAVIINASGPRQDPSPSLRMLHPRDSPAQPMRGHRFVFLPLAPVPHPGPPQIHRPRNRCSECFGSEADWRVILQSVQWILRHRSCKLDKCDDEW